MYRFLQGFCSALFGSVIANLIVLFILKPFVVNPAMPLHALSVAPVAMLTAIGAIGATIVYAILRYFLNKPNRTFIWISIVVLILSLIPDYLIIGMTTGPFAGGTWPSALTLMLMHIVAAVFIVFSLTRIWNDKMCLIPPTLAEPA